MRRISIILSLAIICVLVLTTQIPVFGTETGKPVSITFDSLKDQLLQSNSTVQKLKMAEKQAEVKYDKAVDSANKIAIMGQYFYIKGNPLFITYPSDVQYSLARQKQIIPDQAKYYWTLMGWNRESAQNAMVNGLWGLYIGLENTQLNLDLQQKKLDLAQKVNGADKKKLNQGMITQTDMETSDYNLLAAQYNLKTAQRAKDNMARSMNNLLGKPVGSPIGKLDLAGQVGDIKMESVDYYIKSADNHRMELLDLQNQISMKQNEISVIEDYMIYKNNNIYIQSDYDTANNTLNSLKVQLEKKRFDIEKEIKSAFVDVINSGRDLISLKNTLDVQENSLSKSKNQYSAGLISAITLEQAEVGVQQLENGYKVASLNYQSKYVKLQAASGIGPSY